MVDCFTNTIVVVTYNPKFVWNSSIFCFVIYDYEGLVTRSTNCNNWQRTRHVDDSQLFWMSHRHHHARRDVAGSERNTPMERVRVNYQLDVHPCLPVVRTPIVPLFDYRCCCCYVSQFWLPYERGGSCFVRLKGAGDLISQSRNVTTPSWDFSLEKKAADYRRYSVEKNVERNWAIGTGSA